MTNLTKGSCLCGRITYEVRGKLISVCACHCTQCCKTSGHYVAATKCRSEDLEIVGVTITWYRSSDTAERGFCSTCGSNLFWREYGATFTSIFAGSIDGLTGLNMDRQIHTDTKGDYYDLPDVPIGEQEPVR